MNGLKDRVAIVTAAAGGGIGKATAARLAEEGAIVVVTDSHERRTRETVEELAVRFAGRVDGYPLDVSRREEVERTIAEILSKRGRIDVLVNNAGINVLGDIDKIRVEDWSRILDVNLTGAFYLTRAVLPAMRRQKAGAIVNVYSVAAWVALRRSLFRGEGGAARADSQCCGGSGSRRNPVQRGRARDRANQVGREKHE